MNGADLTDLLTEVVHYLLTDQETVSRLNGMQNLVEYLNIWWWRHQMKTFSAFLALCVGNSSVTGELHSQRPVTRGFDVFFDLRLNKWLVNNRDAGD